MARQLSTGLFSNLILVEYRVCITAVERVTSYALSSYRLYLFERALSLQIIPDVFRVLLHDFNPSLEFSDTTAKYFYALDSGELNSMATPFTSLFVNPFLERVFD